MVGWGGRGEPCGGGGSVPQPEAPAREPPSPQAMAIPSGLEPAVGGAEGAPAHRARPAPAQVVSSILRNLSWRADINSKKVLREVGSMTALMQCVLRASKVGTSGCGGARGTHPGRGHRHHRCPMPATGRGTLAAGGEFPVLEEIKPEDQHFARRSLAFSRLGAPGTAPGDPVGADMIGSHFYLKTSLGAFPSSFLSHLGGEGRVGGAGAQRVP